MRTRPLLHALGLASALAIAGIPCVGALAQGNGQAGSLPPSLFFTPDQVAAIEAALRERARYRPPEQAAAPGPEAPRRLRLGAIIRFGPAHWTIWLNGERVTPANLPQAVQGIDVRPESVTLDWFDARRGMLVQVALRPYQEVLLDSGEVRAFDPAAPEDGEAPGVAR